MNETVALPSPEVPQGTKSGAVKILLAVLATAVVSVAATVMVMRSLESARLSSLPEAPADVPATSPEPEAAMEDEGTTASTPACERFFVSEENNIVAVESAEDVEPIMFTKPKELTVLYSDGTRKTVEPKIVDTIVSEDCRHLAWREHVQTDLYKTTVTIRVAALFGNPTGTASVIKSYQTDGAMPLTSSFDTAFGRFFPDRLVLRLGGGENSPGPGYYPFGVVEVSVFDMQTLLSSHAGTLSSMSPDGEWMVGTSGSYPNYRVFIRNLRTGEASHVRDVSNGPTLYGYEFAADSKSLVYHEIPGSVPERGNDYEGPTFAYVQTLENGVWSEPKLNEN